jgi:transcription initiation factor TFIID subunit TAF12
MHLKLLVARQSLERVVSGAAAEAGALSAQEVALQRRLAGTDLGDDLRRTLQQQAEVIGERRQGHAEAARRRERVQAELERIRQQVSLVREQVLLATDETGLASSVDALSASLDEASRWLQDQQELLGGLEDLAAPPPATLLGRSRRPAAQGESA